MKTRAKLTTEKPNPRSKKIDRRSTLEIVDVINAEDGRVAPAVGARRRELAAAVDIVVKRLRQGGRLFYVGAGTSGRLGVLDAAECPPTFGVAPSMVQGIIAGGRRALVRSAEGCEDVAEDGAAAIDGKDVAPGDTVVGIAACGLTPFVLGAMRRARTVQAATIFVTCCPETRTAVDADVVICPNVGSEVVTGSTRMKAATAIKLVLNTLTTTAMIRLGKVYDNFMVDLKVTNEKLRDRAERIVMGITGLERRQSRWLLAKAGGHVKAAIVMHVRKVDYRQALKLLADVDGFLWAVIE